MFKSTTTSVKSFVARHKVALSITGTAVVTTTACLMLNRAALRQHDSFLEEKGLYDEYYTPEDSYDM